MLTWERRLRPWWSRKLRAKQRRGRDALALGGELKAISRPAFVSIETGRLYEPVIAMLRSV